MINYGTEEQLKEQLLYKRIVKWGGDYLELEDGTIVTIEESEQDCCASAGGEFKDVKLDAVITSRLLCKALLFLMVIQCSSCVCPFCGNTKKVPAHART